MASLVESTGAALRSLFVPANVIEAQAENQRMLEARAQKLNANKADTLARATQNGVMSDGAARQSMQSMDMALFLASQRERELGEEAVQIVKDSAAAAPAVLADNVRGAINGTAATIFRAIPWWIWAIVGLYVAMQVSFYFKMLRR